jgi:hypothetical protein
LSTDTPVAWFTRAGFGDERSLRILGSYTTLYFVIDGDFADFSSEPGEGLDGAPNPNAIKSPALIPDSMLVRRAIAKRSSAGGR